MAYGGMVHALEEIRRILKPTGVLIDIHPVAEDSLVEVHQGGNIDLVGRWTVPQWCTDYQQADDALSEIVHRGLYSVERESVFDSRTYYSTLEEMRADMMESVDVFARDDQSADEAMPNTEALATRAEELVQSALGGAELAVHERAHIRRLKPI